MPRAENAISAASSLGLFEFASLLLAIVAILLALGGVVAFLNLRTRAAQMAREEARQVAGDIAEARAVEYLEDELPKLMDAYRDLARNAVEDDQANEIASVQEREERQ